MPALTGAGRPTEGRLAAAQRVFGGALALVGVVHLIFGEEPRRLFPVWPEGLPGRPLWAHAAGAALAVLGAMVLLGRRGREAAVGIGAVTLATVLTLQLPRALESGVLGNAWLNTLKWSAMTAGALLVASGIPPRFPRARLARALRRGASAAPWLLGAFMALAAYMHLRYTQPVTRLLPSWMPWQMFWVRLTGVTLGAGGLGLVIRPVARLAAALTAVMIFGFFLLVHIPRTLADPRGSTGWLELGESLAFCMIAALLALRRSSDTHEPYPPPAKAGREGS